MRSEYSENPVSEHQTDPHDVRQDVSQRLHSRGLSTDQRWAVRGLGPAALGTTGKAVAYRWIVLNTESEMDAIADLLDSKLIHLSDQLELCAMGWAKYQQHEPITEYLYYDVYDLVGTMIEIIYLGLPEYNLEMARREASVICRNITDKLGAVIDTLKDQFESHLLPALSLGDEDTHIGAVAMVGGDLAVRIDDVTYHASKPVDSHTHG